MCHRIVVVALLALAAACGNGNTPAQCQDQCQFASAQCVSGGVSICLHAADGCLELAPPTACPSGEFCSGGMCGTQCTDQCTLGAKRCAGASVEVCSTQSSGCTDWGAPSACPNNVTCADDACPGACTDSCSLGPATCANGTSVTACQIGPSGCLQLLTTACSGDDICSSGACVPPPVCTSCPDGYSCATGGVCAGGDQSNLTLDVKTVVASGHVTLNGALPAVSAQCDVNASDVIFYETTHGYQFTAPIPCNTGDFSFSITLVPGTYRVSVDDGVAARGANLPTFAVVVINSQQINANVSNLALDVKTVQTGGHVTLNGQLPTVGAQCDVNAADAIFYETTHGYQFTAPIACSTADFSYSLTLVPGTYRVSVDNGVAARGANLPTFAVVVIDTQQITANIPNLVLNISTLSAAGHVTLNGQAPVIGAQCDVNAADAIFYETTHGYQFTAPIPCTTTDFSYSLTLVPGTYRVSVDNGVAARGANLPTFAVVVINSQQVTAALANLVLDVKTLQAAGTITLNGQLPTLGSQCDVNAADAIFYETTHGYQFTAPIPCTTADFSFSLTIVPGTYRISVDNGVAARGANLPTFAVVVIDSQQISADANNLALDVKTILASGTVTLNGQLPAIGSQCDVNAADAIFYETTHGYQFTAPIPCTTGDFSYSVTLVPGTYRVSVDNGVAARGANLPTFAVVVIDSQQLVADTPNLALDVETVHAAGHVTINEHLPQVGSQCDVNAADAIFYETEHGYQFTAPIPCNTADFSFSVTLVPGTYRVSVDNGVAARGANLPTFAVVVIDALKVM